jgi:DNA repair protein RadC
MPEYPRRARDVFGCDRLPRPRNGNRKKPSGVQLDLFAWAEKLKRNSKRLLKKNYASPCEWKIVPVRECVSEVTPAMLDQPGLAVEYWRNNISTGPQFNPDVECFVVVLLNTRLRVRGHHLVSIGSLNETIAHPREVFRAAVIGAAYSVICMHNHPSGDPSPSDADRRMTRNLVEAGAILKIAVTDHIIIGMNRFYSFREAGLL